MKIFIRVLAALILVTFSRYNEVNGECFELVQQYYECKNLVMRDPNKNGTYPPQPYEPNPWVPNNILNDTFYQNLYLDNMTFIDAMDLFWDIYNETNNCDSDFCKCVSTGIIDQYRYGRENHFSLFFRNLTNFEQVKIILLEFIEKFQPSLKSYSELEEFFQSKTHRNQNLPTLAEFCMKYDYTDERYLYYNNSLDCFTDDITVHDCKFDIMVDKKNRTVIYPLNNPIMEKLLTCKLANAHNCPVEKQKFHLLTSWPQEYPRLAWQGDSLSDYYDKLITDSHSINPEIKFVHSDLKTKNDTLLVTNLNLQSSYKISGTTRLVGNLLKSPLINIECTWVKKSDNDYYMSTVNFTFKSSIGTTGFNMNLTTSLTNQREILPANVQFLHPNALYYRVNEPADISLYLAIGTGNYDIYEFYAMNIYDSYMHAYFNTTHFRLYIPDYQWNESSSVFVNGFDGFEPITTGKPTVSTQRTTTSTEPSNSASSTFKLSITFITTFLTLFIFTSF